MHANSDNKGDRTITEKKKNHEGARSRLCVCTPYSMEVSEYPDLTGTSRLLKLPCLVLTGCNIMIRNQRLEDQTVKAPVIQQRMYEENPLQGTGSINNLPSPYKFT